IALNMDQVEEYTPPENPAKVTDSRFETYVLEYGSSSWELDALEPSVIADLVEDEIRSFIKPIPWKAVEQDEDHDAKIIKELSKTLKENK
ncbi:unnamed protein product, partial [marine sediment metagenome]